MKRSEKRKDTKLDKLKKGIKYRNTGLILYQNGEYIKAIKNFNKAIEYFKRGSIRYKWTLDNIDKAKDALQLQKKGEV